jgi:hypothetical protein
MARFGRPQPQRGISFSGNRGQSGFQAGTGFVGG